LGAPGPQDWFSKKIRWLHSLTNTLKETCDKVFKTSLLFRPLTLFILIPLEITEQYYFIHETYILTSEFPNHFSGTIIIIIIIIIIAVMGLLFCLSDSIWPISPC